MLCECDSKDVGLAVKAEIMKCALVTPVQMLEVSMVAGERFLHILVDPMNRS